MKRVSHILLFVLLLSVNGIAQDLSMYYFRFQVADKAAIESITSLISIDNVKGNTVYAFANEKEFKAFQRLGIPYSFIDESKATKALDMATTVSEMALWNRYPTYEVYEQMMLDFATSHPEICKLVEIGTLDSGRKLLAVKISDNVANEWEPEPQLFYTSTMHGDEIAGFVMMLRLIDYLLNNYSNTALPDIARLINNSVIWINPLANPNGTYKGGNHTVSGAIRYNINYVDLNRNFPDPAAGNHPDGYSWQEETVFMMAFANNYPISLSANFHSGEEVVNYPWDTWSALCADNLWWRYVGGNYRDSAQANSPVGYFNGVNNGLTNGYLWYRITGGRQDYMNYFKQAREVTVEISDSKFYPTSSLPSLWNYNRGALLGYLHEGLNGVQGTVVNGHGEPVAAKVTVLNHDFTQSEVYSQTNTGFFARYLKAGTYTFTFSASGYADAVISNVTVIDGQQTPLSVIMNQEQEQICLAIDSIEVQLMENSEDTANFVIKNCGNVPLNYTVKIESEPMPDWLVINKTGNTIPTGAKDTIKMFFNAHSLSVGTYFSHLIIQANDSISVPITMSIIPLQKLALVPDSLRYKLTVQDSVLDSVWVLNASTELKNVSIQSDANWLVLIDTLLEIAPNDSSSFSFYIHAEELKTGFYATHLIFDGDARAVLPFEITVDTLPIIRLLTEKSTKEVLLHSATTDTVWITNVGGGMANLAISSNKDWMQPEFQEMNVLSGDTAALVLHLEVNELTKGIYTGAVIFTSDNNSYTYALQVAIDTLPELYIPVDSLLVLINQGSIAVDTIDLTNRGGGKLPFEVKESISNSWLTVEPKLGFIASDETKAIHLAFDARNLSMGDYSTTLLVNNKALALKLTVMENPKVDFNKLSFEANLSSNQTYSDTLIINNLGNSPLNYSLKIEDELNQPWIQINLTSGTINGNGMELVVLQFLSTSLPIGTYRTHLEVNTGTIIRIPLVLQVTPDVK